MILGACCHQLALYVESTEYVLNIYVLYCIIWASAGDLPAR